MGRRSRLALAAATVAAVGLCGVRLSGRSPASAVTGLVAWLSEDDSDEYTTTTIDRDDLLNFREVCRWIEETETVDDCRSVKSARLDYLLPSKIVTKAREDLIEGSIGVQATKGYFAFNLVYNEDDDACSASWFMIMNVKGEIKTIVPVTIDDEIGRAAGLKLWNDTHVLFAAAPQMKFTGKAYLMNWKTGSYAALMDAAIDIHDIQRSTVTDAVWYPKSSDYKRASASTGEVTYDAAVPGTVADLNHVQVLDDDEYAIFSSRLTNSIIKGKAKTGDLVWELGGDSGEFTITDLDGYTYAAGHSYWKGQHNAEYIGNGEYALFDNNYEHEAAGSRLIVVSVDEDSMEATIEFEYATGAYTKVWGDNDLLPSGNMLATWWQSETFSAAETYDAAIAEIVTADSSTALEVKFYSDRSCATDDCSIDAESWGAYSVERFYSEPLAYSVSCVAGASLAFSTQDTHKAPCTTDGIYRIYDDDDTLLYRGTFDFEAHWRATAVAVDSTDVPGSGYLVVENQYGTTTTESFSC